MKRKILLFLALIPCSVACLAQVVVSAAIDSTALFIGEQAHLTLTATQPQGAVVEFPLFSDTVVSGLEIVEMPVADTVELPDGTIRVSSRYTVTSFDSALIYIPGFDFICGEDTLMSNSLSLKIVDIPVDTTQQAIADIKPVVDPPFDWKFFWTVVCVVLLLAAAAAAVVWSFVRYHRKRRAAIAKDEPEVDPRTAYEIAVQQLDEIQSRHLCDSEQHKLHYTLVTDVLRLYIKRRFAIDALESTSDELLEEYKAKVAPSRFSKNESFEILRNVLNLTDLVKFAKWRPLPDETANINQSIHQFLDITNQPDTAEEPHGDLSAQEK